MSGVRLKMIDRQKISAQAIKLRYELGVDALSPVDISVLVQTMSNMTLVYYPLPEELSGACYKGNGISSLILINSNMSLGRQHFSLAHELYHAFFDKTMPKFICPSNFESRSEDERKADIFACQFLMPELAVEKALSKSAHGREIDMEDVIRLEQYFGVSHASMVIRLKELHFLTESQASQMQSNVKTAAARMGFDTSLYGPSREHERKKVLGHYIDKARKLLDDGTISNGLYEELLLDAGRDDLVFEQDVEYNPNV